MPQANQDEALQGAMPEAQAGRASWPGRSYGAMGLRPTRHVILNASLAPTGRSAGSLAWAGLANSYYWIDQQKGVGGVYLSQILPFADVKSLPLFYAFEKSVYQSMA